MGRPAAAPRERPTLFLWATSWLILDNRIALRPGFAPLDLLAGDTLSGNGGRPRWQGSLDAWLNAGAWSYGLSARHDGATRVRSNLAESDLTFSGRTPVTATVNINVQQLVTKPWAKGARVNLSISNLLNDRVAVRDRTGATPKRFQPALLDPVGRSIQLSLRKLF